jgi:hypothetical protein
MQPNPKRPSAGAGQTTISSTACHNCRVEGVSVKNVFCSDRCRKLTYARIDALRIRPLRPPRLPRLPP